MTDHPLTEAAAVEMWDASPCPEGYEFRGMLTVEQDATVYAMRAAFDAGREHERANPDHERPWEPLNEGDPLPMDVSRIAPECFVGEVVMKSETTAFLAAAQARGCRTQVGSDMLFEQIPAYLEFFGLPTTTAEVLREHATLKY